MNLQQIEEEIRRLWRRLANLDQLAGFLREPGLNTLGQDTQINGDLTVSGTINGYHAADFLNPDWSTITGKPAWLTSTCGFVYMVDGGGAVVTTGDKGFVSIPVAMHISTVKTLNVAASTTTCAIYKCTYANYGTWTLLSSAIGTSSLLKNSQAVNWDFAAGDIIYVNVTACSAANKFSLGFEGYRL